MSNPDVLEIVCRRPGVAPASDLRAFFSATAAARASFPRPIDRAVVSGFAADRLGFAFAAGYEAALSALVPALGPSAIASFCVTEAGGNHPRAIETALTASGDEFVLSGKKKWSTLAPLAEVLVVVAKEGVDGQGRPLLRAVRVDRGAPGLLIVEMPPPPFVPEVPHAELSLDGVRVQADAVLPGDGYTEYTKAFRTVEDLHVNGALLGYLISVAARHGFPAALRERGVALVLLARELASRKPSQAETHVALAGLLEEISRWSSDAEPEWERVGDAERARWQRDRALVQVAGKARDQRRERAWQELAKEGPS